jgi:hypothetical protein
VSPKPSGSSAFPGGFLRSPSMTVAAIVQGFSIQPTPLVAAAARYERLEFVRMSLDC